MKWHRAFKLMGDEGIITVVGVLGSATVAIVGTLIAINM